MPELGLGGVLRRSFGDGLLPIPRAIYVDLATWAKIPFLYSAETRRAVADMQAHAIDPAPVARLARVIEDQLGHELAFAVERGKIDANGPGGTGAIDMGMIEPGLSVRLTAGSVNGALSEAREALRAAIYETLVMGQVAPADVGSVVLVGGSSLMALVQDEARAICPAARLRRAEAFTAVVDGLALATA